MKISKTYAALFVLIALFNFTWIKVTAQVDTINLSNNRLQTAKLKTGLKQYLVYFQNPKLQKSLNFWFWTRDIRKDILKDEAVFTITQHWYGADSSSYRNIYSVNQQSNFAPLYHREEIKGNVAAYFWSEQKIVSDSSIVNKEKGKFSLAFTKPALNWNLDIETLEMLSLASNKTFVLNFYDAGQGTPKYVTYKVVGDELIEMLDGHRVNCWILETVSNSANGKSIQRFWISKKKQEFLKEEDSFNGIFRYKIKMTGTAPNLLDKFNQAQK